VWLPLCQGNLDERTLDFPAAAGDRAVEGLVMNREARDAEQKIGLGITAYVCAAESGEVAAVADVIQKPSWKASVPTFIWLSRKSIPILKSCL
jgi:hypothetical protein